MTGGSLKRVFRQFWPMAVAFLIILGMRIERCWPKTPNRCTEEQLDASK